MCPSGSLFLSRDLPGQKIGCSFDAGQASSDSDPCSHVCIIFPAQSSSPHSGRRQRSQQEASWGHPLPPSSALGGQWGGLCGAWQVGLGQRNDFMGMGSQLHSLDLRRFLPLLHSQAPWNEILTGEKSSKAKIFPTQFQVKQPWKPWDERVSWKMERRLAVPCLSRTRNEGRSPP